MVIESRARPWDNTVSIVMPQLQKLFFLILKGMANKLRLYSKLPVHVSGLVRLGPSLAYDLIAALVWQTTLKITVKTGRSTETNL